MTDASLETPEFSRPISVDDMREIYEILTGLEGIAAEVVAKRGLTEAQATSMA